MDKQTQELHRKIQTLRMNWAFRSWKVVSVCFFIGFAAFLAIDWHEHSDVMKAGVRTEGVVVSVSQLAGCTCKYKFEFGGREIERDGEDCCHLHDGDPIDVFYTTENPESAMNIEPNEHFQKNIWGAGVAFLILPLGIAGFVFRYTKPHAIRHFSDRNNS